MRKIKSEKKGRKNKKRRLIKMTERIIVWNLIPSKYLRRGETILVLKLRNSNKLQQWNNIL